MSASVESCSLPVPSWAQLRDAVAGAAAEECVRAFGRTLRAVVLTGSLARDEATWCCDQRRYRLAGDAEFLAIFHQVGALPASIEMDALTRKIESALAGQGIDGHIVVSAVTDVYLRRLRPHIFGFELRECGSVVWGDPEILRLIPRFTAGDIPLEDAWRLLCNRMIELLEVMPELDSAAPVIPAAVAYRALKLCIDAATSLLLFHGSYEPSYRSRAEQLKALARTESPASRRLGSLECFSNAVTLCTRFKLNEVTPEVAGKTLERVEFLYSLIPFVHKLWRWELMRLTNAGDDTPDEELVRQWAHAQPLGAKLRGWAYASRASGFGETCRRGLAWMRYCTSTSPRYLVYAKAAGLFCQVPRLLFGADASQRDWSLRNDHLSDLPLRPQPVRAPGATWRDVAQAISRNYHTLLEFTRA